MASLGVLQLRAKAQCARPCGAAPCSTADDPDPQRQHATTFPDTAASYTPVALASALRHAPPSTRTAGMASCTCVACLTLRWPSPPKVHGAVMPHHAQGSGYMRVSTSGGPPIFNHSLHSIHHYCSSFIRQALQVRCCRDFHRTRGVYFVFESTARASVPTSWQGVPLYRCT